MTSNTLAQTIKIALFLLLLAPVPALAFAPAVPAPPLQVIPAGQIGDVVTVKGTTSISFTSPTNQTWATSGGYVTRSMYAWSPLQVAGAMAYVGYLFQGMLDTNALYNHAKDDPVLGPIANDALKPDKPLQPGDTLCSFSLPGAVPGTTQGISASGCDALQVTGPTTYTDVCIAPASIETYYHYLSVSPGVGSKGAYNYPVDGAPPANCGAGNVRQRFASIPLVRVSGLVPTYPGALPGELSPEDAQKLADALAAAAAANAQVANALDNLIKQFPGMLTNAQQIAQSALENFMKEYAQKAQQDAIKAAEDALAADPTNEALKAALEALKAQIAQDERDQFQNESASTPSLPAQEIHEVNFQPIKDLAGMLSGKFPFNVFSSISTCISPLCSAPITPEFEIDLKITKQTVSFKLFDSFAAFLRGIMSFILWVSTGYFSIKLYSRM